MSDIAIQLENLGKCYRIRSPLEQSRTFGQSLRQFVFSPFDYLLTTLRKPTEAELVWALRNVSLDIRRGEVVGVIGRNGAGKSTLLKLLSRITDPSTGQANIYGRVASLLEVGAGFHGELTGRENVHLNGAILGMGRREVKRKFDEIISFAGVERFVDTPVKRYSSGMYLRLAFAVAAYLEPEILLIDEVLAVGDAEFQKRCLGKMEDVSRSGRTVLFVSHQMQNIIRLCDRAILLSHGMLAADGPAETVVAKYLSTELGTTAKREWTNRQTAPGNDFVRVRSVRVVDCNGQTHETFDVRSAIGIEIVFEIFEQRCKFVPMLAVYDDRGTHLFNALDTDPVWHTPQKEGCYTSTAWIPGNLLAEGTMTVTILLSTHSSGKAIKQALAREAVAFQVIDPIEGNSARGDYNGPWGGAVRPLLHWTMECIDRALIW